MIPDSANIYTAIIIVLQVWNPNIYATFDFANQPKHMMKQSQIFLRLLEIEIII